MNRKAVVSVIIVVIMAALLGAVGYFIFKNPLPVAQEPTPSPPIQNQATPSTPTSSADETANWKKYRNEKYGFEVKYPPGWHVNSEFPDVEIVSVQKTQYIQGVGYPQFGAVWMVIHPIPCKNECSNGEEVVDVGASKLVVEITKTKAYHAADISATVTYAITFSYWKGDKNESMYRQVFDQILSTLKFIR